jgi:undecaprenyl-diphosphatase
MQLLQAFVLGIVQGLTEFWPISSSGHLLLIRQLFGWELLADAHWNTVFDVSTHAGTFVALLAYFWTDTGRLISAFFTTLRHGIGGVTERRLACVIVMGAIPAGLAGVFGEAQIEEYLRQAPALIAVLLIAFGLLLWLAEWRGRKVRELGQVGWADGLVIGFAQVLSLAPGVSRSGITMTAGLFRGLSRESAARFSFLLSLPLLAGAAIFGLASIAKDLGELPAGSFPVFAAGFLAAAISGYFCIRVFLSYLRTRSLLPFIIYRVVAGVGVLAWLLRA